jgi:hypothetical protein
MKDEKIQELGKKHADFRMLQSNHIYDYKSCYDSYNEGMHQALSIFGVSNRIGLKIMVVTSIISFACGILASLLI